MKTAREVLGKDILNLIFLFFNAHELTMLAQVCKAWRLIADHDSQWERFLKAEHRSNKTSSFKSKFFEIQKQQQRKFKLETALSNLGPSASPQNTNISDPTLQELYMNGCIDFEPMKNLTADERQKLCLDNIVYLLKIKYVTSDDVLASNPTTLQILNNHRLNPLRVAGVLNIKIEQEQLNYKLKDHLEVIGFHPYLINGTIELQDLEGLDPAMRDSALTSLEAESLKDSLQLQISMT